MQTYSLFDLNEYIRRVLALNLPQPVWITAEIAQLKISRKHFYIDLIQIDELTGEIVAQANAVLWDKEFDRINRASGKIVESILREGVELRMQVRVDYHERYGLKFAIQEIDTAYTFGQLELQRRQTLEKLQKLQLLDRNKQVPMPLVMQKIAIISSDTAAGYADFIQHLSGNPYGYQFNCRLFTTAVQGKNTVHEMQQAFAAIAREDFHAVAIIRGGGSKIDLAAFDQFDLCAAAAKLPYPLLTGIGHEVDETVLDRVAYASLKTPTAVADFILDHTMQFEMEVMGTAQAIGQQAALHHKIAAQPVEFAEITLRQLAQNALNNAQSSLSQWEVAVPLAAHRALRLAAESLTQSAALAQAHDPMRILERGFAIVRRAGKTITEAQSLQEGDAVDIQWHRSSTQAIIKKDKKA